MIIVFGSINLDLVAHVRDLPRAGETRTGLSFTSGPGGKGANQALAARLAGAQVAMHGAVGRDAFAPTALARLRAAGVDLAGVRDVDAPTGIALIHVDAAGENTITVIPGANAQARAVDVDDAELGPTSTLLLQLEVPLSEIEALVSRARAAGARIVLNAAPVLPLARALLAELDVLVVNEHEAASLAVSLDVPAEPAAFASALATGRTAVVVTLGAAGALACTPDMRIEVPAPRVQAVDTVGAGDAFVGALAAAFDRGETLAFALTLGVAAGALACTRRGAQEALPERAEIASLAATLRVHDVSRPSP